MSKRTFFRRLFSIEVLAGAVAGATAPYVLSLAIEVAPTRVSIGLVALSVVGALLGCLLVGAVRKHIEKRRAAQERRDRTHQELKTQLEKVELILTAPSARRSRLRRRST